MMRKFSILTMLAISFCAIPANAEEDEEVSILAALGLTAASGKTTLAEGAGEMEGAILSSAMFPQAIDALASEIRKSGGIAGRTLALVDSDDPFDLSLSGAVTNKIRKAIPTSLQCPAVVKKADNGLKSLFEMGGNKNVDTSGAGKMATLIGALKTDASISSYSTTIPEHHLLSSLAFELGSMAMLPAEISVLPTGANSEVLAAYDDLMAAKYALGDCKEHVSIKSQFAKIEATEAAVTAPGKDDAPSLLERAARQGMITKANPLLLRVNMEKAGGTVVNRSNIFLQLGFPGAIVIHNGMKLNFRLVNPATGSVLNAGSILCRQHTAKRFETVYREKIENLRKPGRDRDGNEIAVCERV